MSEIKEKPPFGVRPSYIVIPERIKELADAINRCRTDTGGKQLKEWAYEIALLSDVSKRMREFREEWK